MKNNEMDAYEKLKNELLNINSAMAGLLSRAEALSVAENGKLSQYLDISKKITEKIQGETLRVAVIGAIKSGKSTFVNSLLEGDFLKRGAGVVTAIVTRIRKGSEPTAKLYFKSWDEINTEIQNATTMFPSDQWKSFESGFDLRREADRKELGQALTSLGADALIDRGQRTADSVLLAYYLKGYDCVKDIISSESREQTYSGTDLRKHRNFSGDDSLAIYLKDIQLNLDAGILNNQMEIADCQGSDSPNPHHLAMIQDYLLITNLIVYVISTRTGLRRADIRFLTMIKKMGIMDNTIFVLNCDFSEHERVEDLEILVAKTKEELALICPTAEIFTFSSLYNLFLKTVETLSDKDRARLDQWQLDEALTTFSNGESKRFVEGLHRKLTRERYALLLGNHLERINLSCRGFRHWVHVHRDLLNGDTDRIESIVTRLAEERKKTEVLSSMIRSTLDGAVAKIQKDIRRDVDRFFDPVSGDLIQRLIAFIREFRPESGYIEEEVVSVGFTTALYNLFQQFKNAVDRFMTTTVNPDIVEFVNQCEEKVLEAFTHIAKPFESMVQDALGDYNTTLVEQGLEPVTTREESLVRPNLASVKSVSGLAVPSAAASMRYSGRIKSDAILRYGAYSLARFFRRVFKKSEQPKHTESRKAVKDGIRRIKRETERSIKAHFQDYQEGIKFQYLFKLIKGYADLSHEALMDYYTAHQADLSDISNLMSAHRSDKRELNRSLDDLAKDADQIIAQIGALTTQLTGGVQDERKAN